MMRCQIINFSTEQLHVLAEKYIGMFRQEFSAIIVEAYCILN